MRAPIGTAPSAARQSGAVATASGPGDVAPHRCRNFFLAASLIVLIDFWPVRMTLLVWMIIYALASMKAVYGGRWAGVVLRALLIAAAYAVFFTAAVVGLILAAVTLR